MFLFLAWSITSNNGAFRDCPRLTSIAVRKAIQDTGYNWVKNRLELE